MKKLKAGSSAKGIMAGAIGEAAGAAVSESEYEQLKALQEGASLREDILKELKGSAVSENEMEKLKNKKVIKKSKGGEIVIGKGKDYIKDLL